MKLLLVLAVTLACLDTLTFANDSSPCGDWEQYKDEHCYKLFDSLVSYSDAEKTCTANNSSLRKAVDNVWIGARYVGNKQFNWADHTPLTSGPGHFTNWATGSPKNLSDYCVQMQADVSLLGKWVDEPCARKNLVVCQRTPTLSLKLLAETIIVLKHSLLQISEQLATTRIESEKEITALKKNTVPIGFTYVQMPKDKSPEVLWPGMTWTDVSDAYKGVFFRVAGGNASDFGEVQPYNAPRLETVYKMINYNHNLTIPVSGWSDGISSGSTYSANYLYYMNFKHSEVEEVRPVNMAVKVYRRTA
ncbi:hypothetical protein TYRP_019523 [Tyrophagus putrescentiae]|nr:hypothetical protein TYRP_019523 [Tyrophagus putrescentiae]